MHKGESCWFLDELELVKKLQLLDQLSCCPHTVSLLEGFWRRGSSNYHVLFGGIVELRSQRLIIRYPKALQ